MDARFIVHLGTHKTGTSVIQRFLAANAIQLARQGCNFIRVPSRARKMFADPSLADRDAAIALKEAILQSVLRSRISLGPARQNQLFLISWEGFCGNALSGYANAATLATRLSMALGECEARLLIYLRRQDDFIESMYSQFVRQAMGFSFQDYLECFRPGEGFDWLNLCRAYANAFGADSLCVRLYEASCFPERDSILRDFCSAAGFVYQDFHLHEGFFDHQNQGWPRGVVELARLGYVNMPDKSRRVLSSFLDKCNSRGLFERYSYFTPDERVRFMSAYEASNARVASEYLDRPGEALFSPVKAGAYPQQEWSGLSAQSLVPLLAHLVLQSEPEASSLIKRVNRFRRGFLRRWREFLGRG